MIALTRLVAGRRGSQHEGDSLLKKEKKGGKKLGGIWVQPGDVYICKKGAASDVETIQSLII